jgi:hypothetical protein
MSYGGGMNLSSMKAKFVDTNIGRLAFTARNAVELIRVAYRSPAGASISAKNN